MRKEKIKKYIPEESSPLQEKFINYIMRMGKKSTARRIFNEAMKIISKTDNGGTDPEKVFKTAIENVKPAMEVKPKRIGGGVYQVPREVPSGRQLFLACKWILDGARNRKGAGMAQKLATELLDASKETGSAIKKRDDTLKMAQANKAFAHLAKY